MSPIQPISYRRLLVRSMPSCHRVCTLPWTDLVPVRPAVADAVLSRDALDYFNPYELFETHMGSTWISNKAQIGPKSAQCAWGARAQMGPSPNGPLPKWARAQMGSEWARAQMGPDPDGPGPKWAWAQMGLGARSNGPGPNGLGPGPSPMAGTF